MINIHSSIVFKSAVLFALLALGIFFVVSPAAAAAEDGAAAATFETFIKDTLIAHRMPSGTVLYDVICHTVGETLPPVSSDMTQPGDVTTESGTNVTMPPVQFSAWCGDTYVSVDAPADAFPAGTRMVVSSVEASQVSDAVNKAIEGDVGQENMLAVDITFLCVIDGIEKEIEPARSINVSFRSDLVRENSNTKVLHVDDAGDATVIRSVTDADSGYTRFESDAFSVYVIVSEGDDARLKVTFRRADGTNESIYVKKGDNMTQVLYDPGVGTLADGVYFRGWTTDENYTYATIPKTIEDVRNDCINITNAGVTDAGVNENGTAVIYYAMLFRQYSVTYLDENNVSLGEIKVPFRADSTQTSQPYTVSMAYTAQDDQHHFEGWLVYEGSSDIVGYNASDEPYQNGQNINITGNITFSVHTPPGHWFVFYENGKGGTYNAPQFLEADEKPVRPDDADMRRNGYTFGGWFNDQDVANETSGGTVYDFDQTISDRTEVYARWIPNATAGYTVLIWKESTDSTDNNKKYDFAASKIVDNGTVGQTVASMNTVVTVDNGDTPVSVSAPSTQRLSGKYEPLNEVGFINSLQ